MSARELDVDVSVEDEGAYEIALRAGETTLTRVHPIPGRPDEDAVDDDVICRAEARVRVRGGQPAGPPALAGGVRPTSTPTPAPALVQASPTTDWRAVEVRLGAVRVDLPRRRPGDHVRVAGRVHAKVPAALAHRFKDLAHVTGSVIADVEVDYDGGSPPLPRVEGHVSAQMPGIDSKVFGKQIDLDVAVGGSTVHATKLVAQWADGKVSIPEV